MPGDLCRVPDTMPLSTLSFADGSDRSGTLCWQGIIAFAECQARFPDLILPINSLKSRISGWQNQLL